MTFEELETAVAGGWTVCYKDTSNIVVSDFNRERPFPFSRYAVEYADGSLGYIAEFEGTDSYLFVDQG